MNNLKDLVLNLLKLRKHWLPSVIIIVIIFLILIFVCAINPIIFSYN